MPPIQRLEWSTAGYTICVSIGLSSERIAQYKRVFKRSPKRNVTFIPHSAFISRDKSLNATYSGYGASLYI